MLRKTDPARKSGAKQSSRVRRHRLIPLTEPYVRATYTAHAINLPKLGDSDSGFNLGYIHQPQLVMQVGIGYRQAR